MEDGHVYQICVFRIKNTANDCEFHNITKYVLVDVLPVERLWYKGEFIFVFGTVAVTQHLFLY